MDTKKIQDKLKNIEDLFRYHSLEGEDAFYAICSRYHFIFREKLEDISQRIIHKGYQSYQRVEKDRNVERLLKDICSEDSKGSILPIWYQHFVGRRFREGSGKFFTPHPIAAAMAELLPVQENRVIMDPTCGGGTFLAEASKSWGKNPCMLIGNDLENSLVDLTQMILYLGTPKNQTKQFTCTNIYSPDAKFREFYGKVDYILANPPFSLQIQNLDVESKLFSLGYKTSDALFIDLAYNLLKPKGRLVCLLPHSVIANNEYQKLRKAVEEIWDIRGVIGMPEGIFYLTSGTTARADIIILEKKSIQSQEREYPLVFAFASSVGVALNKRRKIYVKNELETIVNHPRVRNSLSLQRGEKQ